MQLFDFGLPERPVAKRHRERGKQSAISNPNIPGKTTCENSGQTTNYTKLICRSSGI